MLVLDQTSFLVIVIIIESILISLLLFIIYHKLSKIYIKNIHIKHDFDEKLDKITIKLNKYIFTPPPTTTSSLKPQPLQSQAATPDAEENGLKKITGAENIISNINELIHFNNSPHGLSKNFNYRPVEYLNSYETFNKTDIDFKNQGEKDLVINNATANISSSKNYMDLINLEKVGNENKPTSSADNNPIISSIKINTISYAQPKIKTGEDFESNILTNINQIRTSNEVNFSDYSDGGSNNTGANDNVKAISANNNANTPTDSDNFDKVADSDIYIGALTNSPSLASSNSSIQDYGNVSQLNLQNGLKSDTNNHIKNFQNTQTQKENSEFKQDERMNLKENNLKTDTDSSQNNTGKTGLSSEIDTIEEEILSVLKRLGETKDNE